MTLTKRFGPLLRRRWDQRSSAWQNRDGPSCLGSIEGRQAGGCCGPRLWKSRRRRPNAGELVPIPAGP